MLFFFFFFFLQTNRVGLDDAQDEGEEAAELGEDGLHLGDGAREIEELAGGGVAELVGEHQRQHAHRLARPARHLQQPRRRLLPVQQPLQMPHERVLLRINVRERPKHPHLLNQKLHPPTNKQTQKKGDHKKKTPSLLFRKTEKDHFFFFNRTFNLSSFLRVARALLGRTSPLRATLPLSSPDDSVVLFWRLLPALAARCLPPDPNNCAA